MDKASTIVARLGGRKFIAVMTVLVLSFIGLLMELISEGSFERIVLAALAIYGVANVTQKIKTQEPV